MVVELFDPSFFWLKLMLNCSKLRLFSKMRPNLIFSPLALSLLEVDTLKLRPYSSQAQKSLSLSRWL